MKSIRQLIQNLKGWITELGEKRKELLAQKAAEEATLLPNLLMKYMEIRKEERKDWTRAGQNRGTSQDLKAVSEALSYLRQKGLSTVEDLEAFLEPSGKSAADYEGTIYQYNYDNVISCARIASCCAGVFICLHLGTICPKAASPGCRSPPCLRSVHPPTHELNGGNANDDHQSEGLLRLVHPLSLIHIYCNLDSSVRRCNRNKISFSRLFR